MQVLCLYGTRKSKPRVHLAQVKVLWQIQKFMCYCTVFVFILNLRATSKYKPPGAYIWRGDLPEGFLRQEFGGLVFGGAYFRNFTVIYEKTKGKLPGELHVR